MEIKKHYASFSEAIRAAIGVIPQSFFGASARAMLKVDDGKMCAIEAGGALIGVQPREFGPDYEAFEYLYPYLKTFADCPRCNDYCDTLTNLIWHLNDCHQASFGEIADWLYAEEERLGYVTLENVPEAQVTRESGDSIVTPELAGVFN